LQKAARGRIGNSKSAHATPKSTWHFSPLYSTAPKNGTGSAEVAQSVRVTFFGKARNHRTPRAELIQARQQSAIIAKKADAGRQCKRSFRPVVDGRSSMMSRAQHVVTIRWQGRSLRRILYRRRC
jgi:hypothetical protein